MKAAGPGQPASLLLDIFNILQKLGMPSAIVEALAVKLFAGGPQDVMDAGGILRVSREHLDADLSRKVARGYGTEVLEKPNSLLRELPLTDPPA